MKRQTAPRSRSERRRRVALAVLAASLLVSMALALALGNTIVPLSELIAAALGRGTADSVLIVGVLRMPRILLAVLGGAALGVSGALLQSMIRNPLASPDIMGITGGAAFAAVAFITYGRGAVGIAWLPPAAFAGAVLVSVIIYALAWHRGVAPTRLVLIGIGISAAAGALTTLMITISPITAASQAYVWLIGSVYGASWGNVYTLLPWVAVLIPLALAMSRNAAVQQMGDDTATGLGARVQLHRGLLLLISVGLAGAAVAICGAVGFVGLIAPHIARRLVGPTSGLVPAAALTGSLVTLLADTVARTAFVPHDIPVGVLTAAIGAPFFIFLLYRSRNQ